MRRALARAGLAPHEVDHVNAHGTSTPLNDVAESQALRTVFGDHADRLPVASTKGVTGHLLGAAGGIEAIASVESLRRGRVPPTANLDRPDPACDIFLPARALDADLRVVASNAFGFGGSNTTVLFRRWGD
jgi:3-oxoacyl-[acyl-carrier-protein] synthase II